MKQASLHQLLLVVICLYLLSGAIVEHGSLALNPCELSDPSFYSTKAESLVSNLRFPPGSAVSSSNLLEVTHVGGSPASLDLVTGTSGVGLNVFLDVGDSSKRDVRALVTLSSTKSIPLSPHVALAPHGARVVSFAYDLADLNNGSLIDRSS